MAMNPATASAAPRFVGARATDVDLSVVLVSFNTASLLPRCIAALRAASGGLRVQVIVVDNASSDGSLALLRSAEFADLELIVSPSNVGFGRANNLALPRCRGRCILLLNTDAFVAPDALQRALRYLDAHSDVGIVGAALTGEDGAPQPACRDFPTPATLFLQRTGLERWRPAPRRLDASPRMPVRSTDCDWVPGCFMLMRRATVLARGLFDPRFFLYCEEVDLCRRVHGAGLRVVCVPEVRVVHLGGESAKAIGPLARHTRQISSLQIESQLLYFRKHHGALGVAQWLGLMTVGAVAGAARHLLAGRAGAAADGARELAALWSGARHTAFGGRAAR
jgi:N-acetylglucosaminyl-diphospho-decaprenol L-rhamnosyltransferase